MIGIIIALFIGCGIGILIMSLVTINNQNTKDKTIRKQFDENSEIRKEMIKFKGAAASEEQRADLLQKMKDDLQAEYDQLAREWKELVTDYKKIYLELDRIKAAEVRKFRTPEEIEDLLKIEVDLDGILKDLTTIEEMLLEAKNQKVKLAVGY